VTVHVPGFSGTPEPVETIALVSKAVELYGLARALARAVATSSNRSPQLDLSPASPRDVDTVAPTRGARRVFTAA
jgi:hypothetical protein